MSTKKKITLITVADNYFIPLLAALTKSIDVNHRSDELIDYYIVDDDISPVNKRRLQEGLKNPKLNIIWVAMNEALPPSYPLPLDNSSFPYSIFVRLCLPFFIPEEVERIIYLDADMLVLEDISTLWYTNIGEHTIAGVVDRSEVVSSEWGGIKNYKELGLPPETKYFNTGVLLINLEQWRSENRTQRLLQCISENGSYLNFPDQYALNVVFANEWYELDRRWNSFPMIPVEDPFLIHFIDRKPIFKRYDYSAKYKELFFHYLDQTDWKNYKLRSEFSRLSKKAYDMAVKKLKKAFQGKNNTAKKKEQQKPMVQIPRNG
jgi:lipopolysaccharide biosynthesis glycosyltransferase